MDLRRLRAGEWIAAASGAALLVSLFLPWYGPSTGWETLAAFDVLLGLIAAFPVALLLITAAQRVPAVPMALTVFSTFAGMLGVVLVGVRILAPAGTRGWGVWLALAATFGIAVGALMAMRDERLPPAPRS